MSQRLTGDPERLLKLIQANALTDDGAEAEPHSEPASRVIAVPPPTRKFASREEFIRWTQSRT
jgi:hypothetical protein